MRTWSDTRLNYLTSPASDEVGYRGVGIHPTETAKRKSRLAEWVKATSPVTPLSVRICSSKSEAMEVGSAGSFLPAGGIFPGAH